MDRRRQKQEQSAKKNLKLSGEGKVVGDCWDTGAKKPKGEVDPKKKAEGRAVRGDAVIRGGDQVENRNVKQPKEKNTVDCRNPNQNPKKNLNSHDKSANGSVG